MVNIAVLKTVFTGLAEELGMTRDEELRNFSTVSAPVKCTDSGDSGSVSGRPERDGRSGTSL